MGDAPRPAVTAEEVAAAILATRWPNGDRLDGVTSKTANMMAESVVTALAAQVAAAPDREALARVPEVRELRDQAATVRDVHDRDDLTEYGEGRYSGLMVGVAALDAILAALAPAGETTAPEAGEAT